MQYTSATANKLLKKITAERDALLKKEQKLSTFNCSAGEDEDKLRPKYDMAEYKMRIRTLNKQITSIKHAINLANCNCKVPNADGLTVDQLLIVLPMLTEEVRRYADMAQRLPRERVDDRYSSSAYVDYVLTNYDPDDARKLYEVARDKLTRYQIALDEANHQMIIDIDL